MYRDTGYVTLNRCRSELGSNEGMNFITAASNSAGGERVASVCLDRFCREKKIDRIDLLKLDIQGQEHSALVGASGLLRSGQVGTIFIELNWGQNETEEGCPATDAVRILQHSDYVFAAPHSPFVWREAGDWLRSLSDVVARRTAETG